MRNTKQTCLHDEYFTSNRLFSDTCLLYTSPSPRDLSTSRMPSSAWKKKQKKRTIAIMVVYVCGTGCQFFVENDHKLGCAASVEHTPHPLGRPSSYSLAVLRVKIRWARYHNYLLLVYPGTGVTFLLTKKSIGRTHSWRFSDTIREDRTSLINTTWTGHRMVYDMWQGVYCCSPHQRSDVPR